MKNLFFSVLYVHEKSIGNLIASYFFSIRMAVVQKPALERLWTRFSHLSRDNSSNDYDANIFSLFCTCARRLKVNWSFPIYFGNKIAAVKTSFRTVMDVCCALFSRKEDLHFRKNFFVSVREKVIGYLELSFMKF